ncbi:MAG: hypothetical protein ACFWUL_03285 [Dialister sp.]
MGRLSANLGWPRRSYAGPVPTCAALFGEESLLLSHLHFFVQSLQDPICGGAAVNSPPFSKGDVCASRQRDSYGFFSLAV